MRQPTLTLAGLLAYDDTVLDTLQLPEALESDREVITDNIMLDTYGLEVVYPDPDFFKVAVGSWSRKMLPVWTELEATLHYEYDPIANYDRVEHWSDNRIVDQDTTGSTTHGHRVAGSDSLQHGETIAGSDSLSHGESIAGSDSLAHGHKVDGSNKLQHGESISTTGSMTHGEQIATSGTNDQTVENQTTGYNSNTYHAMDKSITDQDTTGSERHSGTDNTTGSEAHSGTDTGTTSESHSGTDTRTTSETHSGTDARTTSETHSGTDARTTSETHSGTDSEQGTLDLEESNVRDGYARGNIGVTTTQQMIEAQRQVVLFNMVDVIVNDFKNRFCLLVY